MYTIKNNIENIIEIKKSKFITKLYKVYNIDEVNNILKLLNKEYPDATHICYAYHIENNLKFKDDNEPSGTAGLPMMEVLTKNNIDFVLAVVIRYFGGIKLGASGLTRAYSNAVSDTLKLVKINEIIPGYKIKITTNYENIKKLDYQLKNISNIKKEFLENITYILEVDSNTLETLKEWDPIVLNEIKIEKE